MNGGVMYQQNVEAEAPLEPLEQSAADVLAEAREMLYDALSILDMWEMRPSQSVGGGGSGVGVPMEGVVSLAFALRTAAMDLRERLQMLRNRIGTL